MSKQESLSFAYVELCEETVGVSYEHNKAEVDTGFKGEIIVHRVLYYGVDVYKILPESSIEEIEEQLIKLHK